MASTVTENVSLCFFEEGVSAECGLQSQATATEHAQPVGLQAHGR